MDKETISKECARFPWMLSKPVCCVQIEQVTERRSIAPSDVKSCLLNIEDVLVTAAAFVPRRTTELAAQ